LKGWKTWTAAGIAMGTALLDQLGYGALKEPLYAIAVTLGMVGVAHKIEKSG
jgi:hypothetical protein